MTKRQEKPANGNWESYARCRAFLFSHSDAFTAEKIPLADTPPSVLAKTGVELKTGGESDIEMCSWHKDTSQPCGVLSITLKPRSNWGLTINPNDVIFVYMTGDKNSIERLISIVSVDNVTDTRTVDGNNATITTFQIHCRDIGGKVLMETPLVYDQAVAQIELLAGLLPEFSKIYNTEGLFASPSLMIMQLLSMLFALKQNFVVQKAGIDPLARQLRSWLFPGSQHTLVSMLDIETHVQSPMVGATAFTPAALSSANSLWSLCEMYANRLVNEFFVDIRDRGTDSLRASNRAAVFAQRFLSANGEDETGESAVLSDVQQALLPELNTADSLTDVRNRLTIDPVHDSSRRYGAPAQRPRMAIVHRQLPYDTFSFYMLPTTVVDETEVYDASLSKSNHEVFNLFRVNQPGLLSNIAEDVFMGLTINPASAAKHGLRRFIGETIFMFPGKRAQEAWSKGERKGLFIKPVYDYYMSLVTTWHAHNDRLLSGSISMRLKPEIRVGQRLTYKRTHMHHKETLDFYVQSVSHTFSSQPGASRTTVSVIRGVNRASDGPETQLYWSEGGRRFGDRDPYVVVKSARLVATEKTDATPDGGVGPNERPKT